MSSQLVERPRQGRGRGVAAGEQDGDELVAQHLSVAREAREGVQERVAFFGLGLGGEFFGGETERVVDEWVDEFVEDFEFFVEGCSGEELVERSGLC